MTLRIAVTGRNGQLARSLVERAALDPKIDVILAGLPELDLTQPASVEPALLAAQPDLIVNAAAYTAVDRAESEPSRAFAVNQTGAEAVARVAAKYELPLIHVSTDYVFSGAKGSPYVEADPPEPLNVYGLSKLAGERAVMTAHPRSLVLRTSWVFSRHGTNFVKTMIRLATERDELRVVDDQLGNPTFVEDLADAILGIAPLLQDAGEPGGIYHYTGAGSTSWCGFARYIVSEIRKRGKSVADVVPIASADYPTPARRPLDTRLETTAFTRRFGVKATAWQTAVNDILDGG